MYKIINWAGVSNALTSNPRQIRANYDGKKYAELVAELRDFESKWLDKATGQKEKREEHTDVNKMSRTEPLNLQNVSGSASSDNEAMPAHNCPYCSHKSYLIDEHFAHIEMFHSGKPIL